MWGLTRVPVLGQGASKLRVSEQYTAGRYTEQNYVSRVFFIAT